MGKSFGNYQGGIPENVIAVVVYERAQPYRFNYSFEEFDLIRQEAIRTDRFIQVNDDEWINPAAIIRIYRMTRPNT
jgi:hypothetical protein